MGNGQDTGSLTRCAGDTKAGTLIGQDKYGNKYFENLEEELPRKDDLRTRQWRLPAIERLAD